MMLIDNLYPVLLLIIATAALAGARRMLWYRRVKRFATSGNYTMHYQPIVSSDHSRQIVALEALICLPESFGSISKERVMCCIERSAWSWRFARAIFSTVLQDYALYFRENPVIISINISPRDICCNVLVDFILTTLHEARIPAGTFMLELTERTRAPSKGVFINNLHRLRKGGVLLAIDDAGKGYSNSIIAMRFPFDYVKTEIAMLEDENMTCTEGGLSMAIQDAHRGVIVERVQTLRDVSLVQRVLSHSLLQGWFYWRAMPASEASVLLQEQPEMRTS